MNVTKPCRVKMVQLVLMKSQVSLFRDLWGGHPLLRLGNQWKNYLNCVWFFFLFHNILQSTKWTGYNCTCADGWEGQNCTDDIDECESDPCQHGGTCNDAVNSFNCSCTSGEGNVSYIVKGNSLTTKMKTKCFHSSKLIRNWNSLEEHLRFLLTCKKKKL